MADKCFTQSLSYYACYSEGKCIRVSCEILGVCEIGKAGHRLVFGVEGIGSIRNVLVGFEGSNDDV